MKRSLLTILVTGLFGAVMAQPCTPDPQFADSVFGVWPDTTTNFAAGTVGEPYFQQLDLIAPADAGQVDPTFAGVTLHSIRLVGVNGLPPGLTYACASQTADPCTFLVDQLGCGVIQGTPTQAGTYDLELQVTAFINVFGNPVAWPDPLIFDGYSITIGETVGITELAGPTLAGVRNVPNPFAVRTWIEFQLARAGDVRVRIFNLVGEELWSQRMQGRAGANRVQFDSGTLQEGVYLYKVESGKETFTGRMVLHR